METGARAFPVSKNPSSDAERYLLAVRNCSYEIPDVMAMNAPPLPAPLTFVSVPRPPSIVFDESWVACTLSSFVSLRDLISLWASKIERGYCLPQASLHVAHRLSSCGAVAWRQLCFGKDAVPTLGQSESNNARGELDAEESGDMWSENEEEGEEECLDSGGVSNEGATQFWCADSEGGGEDEEGEIFEDVEVVDGAAMLSDDRGSDSHDTATPIIPPFLSYILGLDQLSVIRSITRIVYHLEGVGSGSPLPPSRAAWLYGLLAALQMPLLDNTSATLRQLYLLLQPYLTDDSPADSRAPAAILSVVTGKYFGQTSVA